MKLKDLTTIDQLTDFLPGTQAVAFSVMSDKDACYRWIQEALASISVNHLYNLRNSTAYTRLHPYRHCPPGRFRQKERRLCRR